MDRPNANGLKHSESRKEQSPELVLVTQSLTVDNPFAGCGYEFWPLLLKMTKTPVFLSPDRLYVHRDTDTHDTQTFRDLDTQETQDTHETNDTQDSALSASVLTLKDAVQYALARGIDDNSTFRFCRGLRTLERNRNKRFTPKENEAHFKIYFSAVLLKDSGAVLDQWRHEFNFVLPKAKIPVGESPVALAVRRADDEPLPHVALTLDARLARLVAACWHLSDAGKRPFYISVRDAAEILKTPNKFFASAMLAGLVSDGVFQLVKKGQAKGRQASEYKFCSGQLG